MGKSNTSFVPGESGNPDGRPPKDWTMTQLYKDAGEEADETGESRKKIVARKLWEIAQKGDVTAIKELGNRIDGMPKQSVEHSGEIKGNTIVFTDFNATESK
jgi:hypothetical protein